MYLYLSLVERKVAEFYHNMVKMTYFHRFLQTIDGVLIMVADGEKWLEESWLVKNKPDNLNLVLGLSGGQTPDEGPGRTTNLNIFSSALPVEQMILQTSPEAEKCGLEGDFLS